MKTMRYRIRVIALVLICSLLAVVLWTAKAAWFPAGDTSENSSTFSSVQTEDPWSEPTSPQAGETQDSTEETPVQAEEMPSPEPLFDTFGL